MDYASLEQRISINMFNKAKMARCTSKRSQSFTEIEIILSQLLGGEWEWIYRGGKNNYSIKYNLWGEV